jgi:DNA-binding NarL/FixJ family response regulator
VKPIRVLLVDDERLVRAGLRMILRSEPGIEVVGEAGDGVEAVDAARRLDPDVVLMDVRMPVRDGIAATSEIVGSGPDAPHVVVLTTFDLDDYVYGALRAGASGFLLKDAPVDQLIAAIRVAADGGSLFAPAATRRLVERFAGTAPWSPPPGLAELTPREAEVLRLVAQGLSNREIAGALTVTEHTAKTHVAHVLGKLGVRDRVGAVIAAYESGVVEPGSAAPAIADQGQRR